jgi:hypothetical protein
LLVALSFAVPGQQKKPPPAASERTPTANALR